MNDHPRNRFSDKGWVIVSKVIITVLATSLLGWACWATAQGMKVTEHEIKISHNERGIASNLSKIEKLEKVQEDVSVIRTWVEKQR